MRRFASLLMAVGLLVGMLMSYFVFAGGPAPWGLEWIVWIGMIKLGLAGSLGLMGAGAFVRRMAIRREQRDKLASSAHDRLDDTTGSLVVPPQPPKSDRR